ncbi:hypothetical protein HK104_006271 [Borealophlyctis nickersoniae]|nr:hypothetical protein HK104_006271 [Borealophlyctis nickersoniae]
MADPAPPPQQAQQAQQAAPQQPAWKSILSQALKLYLIYQVVNYFKGGSTPASPPVLSKQMNPNGAGDADIARPPVAYAPLWKLGTETKLQVYLQEEEWFNPNGPNTRLIWKEDGITYGNFNDVREKELQIPVSERVQNNGSLYAHIFLTMKGAEHNPADPRFVEEGSLYYRQLLTRYMPKRKVVQTKKLVSGGNNDENEKSIQDDHSNEALPTEAPPIVSYWWPNATINVIPQEVALAANTPPLLMQHVRISRDGRHYYPIFFVNDFWMLNDQLMPINDTVKTLNMTLSFSSIAYWKFQMYKTVEENFRVQNSMLGVESSETDQMKRMFLETNPVLLGVTIFVSILHSIFDFLAFKNDIQYWKGKKDMEGLSFRAIVLNVFFQLIILLYLLDNNTSWMIIISNAVGLVIEAWKIQKTVIVQRKNTFPFIQFIDRVKPSKLVAKTQKYDQMAFKYLSWVMYPCLLGYAIYSLIYEEHKSWYSYIVSTLVGFVYAFGFIGMTPQLFINYKLKSVAHMPWKSFMYKALNTFVDDLFAFVIKMPLLHRIACLRDDVVFVVYLYQRWIYPEDKRRRNEFGQVGEAGDDDDSDEEETTKLVERENKEEEREGEKREGKAGKSAPQPKETKKVK